MTELQQGLEAFSRVLKVTFNSYGELDKFSFYTAKNLTRKTFGEDPNPDIYEVSGGATIEIHYWGEDPCGGRVKYVCKEASGKSYTVRYPSKS